MNITIQYTGQLATLTGTAEESLDISAGTTLAELIARLAAHHGSGFAELLQNREGKPRPSLLVILDGEQALGKLETLCLDGVKVLMLMTPIAGG